jgi:hypothetical protein
MPLAKTYREVYDQVYKPTCHVLGYKCWRVDESPTIGTALAPCRFEVVGPAEAWRKRQPYTGRKRRRDEPDFRSSVIPSAISDNQCP